MIGDAAFTLIPLIFFAIGMRMRCLLKGSRYATVRATATVVSIHHAGVGNDKGCYPEYEFQVGEETIAHMITGVYLRQPWIEPFTGMEAIQKYGYAAPLLGLDWYIGDILGQMCY